MRDTVFNSLLAEDHEDYYLTTVICTLPLSASEIKAASRKYPVIKKMTSYLSNGLQSVVFEGNIE